MISGSAGPVPSLEASIIPTSRRSEMTMMRVLLLGFTDVKKKTRPKSRDFFPGIHAGNFRKFCFHLCFRYVAF